MTTTTRTTRKAPWAVVLTALLAVLGMVFGVMAAVPAAADPDPTQVCAPLDSGKIDTVGDPASVTITAPEGMLITGYCVKAGSKHQGLGPEYVTLATPVESLTITHSSGKDVSNYSYSLGEVPTYYYTPSAIARDTACTLVEETWTADFPFSVTVTGSALTKKGEDWTTDEKAAEDAKLQSQADDALAALMDEATIDDTGANCTPPPPPPTPGEARFCVAPAGTTAFGYDTFGTTDNTKPQETWTNGSGQPLSAYVVGTAADCTPPPPPPPTEPEPVTAVEAATVTAPVLPATVEEPTEVAVPAAATLPATIPAGDPAPTVPIYVLALLALGATALATSTVHLVRTTR